MQFILGLLATILEKITLGWWVRHKQSEADNVENEVNSLSDAAVDDEMQRWTRP